MASGGIPCGPGRYRGGLGLVRQYRLLAAEAMMQIRADRAWPCALWPVRWTGGGGHPLNQLNDQTLPSKTTRTIHQGDVLRHEQAGGGGYGDPLLREVSQVAAGYRR